MNIRKYLSLNRQYLITRYNIIVLISVVILATGFVFIESEDIESTDITRWPYDAPKVYRYDYFDLYSYIDSYHRMTAGIGIFDNIVDYSQLNYFSAMRLTGTIISECEKYNIDPNLVFAIILVESSFRPQIISDRGAVGMMQILPSTAKFISDQMGYNYKDKKSLLNPVTNVRIGIAYFSYLYDKFGYLPYALWAYNYGPEKYGEIVKRNPDFIPYYVKHVMKSWRYFRNN